MTKEKAKAVDPELEEKMAQKLEKDLDGHDWYGAELKADSAPLMDPGSGKPVILRMFDFMFDNKLRLSSFPDKQQLFSAHANQIMTLLWGDGLRPVEGINPRVAIDKKKRTYRIIVAAEPRLHQMVIETPKSLNTMLATAGKKK